MHFYEENGLEDAIKYLISHKATKRNLKILAKKQNKFEQDFENMLSWDNKEKTVKYNKDKIATTLKIFDMQNDLNTITNLNNYCDIDHYSPAINSQIINQILKNEYRVDDLRKYKKSILNFKNSVKSYKIMPD